MKKINEETAIIAGQLFVLAVIVVFGLCAGIAYI